MATAANSGNVDGQRERQACRKACRFGTKWKRRQKNKQWSCDASSRHANEGSQFCESVGEHDVAAVKRVYWFIDAKDFAVRLFSYCVSVDGRLRASQPTIVDSSTANLGIGKSAVYSMLQVLLAGCELMWGVTNNLRKPSSWFVCLNSNWSVAVPNHRS